MGYIDSSRLGFAENQVLDIFFKGKENSKTIALKAFTLTVYNQDGSTVDLTVPQDYIFKDSIELFLTEPVNKIVMSKGPEVKDKLIDINSHQLAKSKDIPFSLKVNYDGMHTTVTIRNVHGELVLDQKIKTIFSTLKVASKKQLEYATHLAPVYLASSSFSHGNRFIDDFYNSLRYLMEQGILTNRFESIINLLNLYKKEFVNVVGHSELAVSLQERETPQYIALEHAVVFAAKYIMDNKDKLEFK